MPSLISHLDKSEQTELLQNLNYLNIQELKSICNKLNIPYFINMEMPDGHIKQTRDMDRKGIVLKRIKYFLNTGKIQKQTIYLNSVICTDKLSNPLQENIRVFYGQFKSTDKNILFLMKRLTSNQFKFGAIAIMVLRDCWSKNIAPTYKEFAKLWLAANKAHIEPNPEWAFLTDRKKGIAGNNWKRLRIQKAKAAMKILNAV